jgi:tetratricopeptide (TPR) repeat protein
MPSGRQFRCPSSARDDLDSFGKACDRMNTGSPQPTLRAAETAVAALVIAVQVCVIETAGAGRTSQTAADDMDADAIASYRHALELYQHGSIDQAIVTMASLSAADVGRGRQAVEHGLAARGAVVGFRPGDYDERVFRLALAAATLHAEASFFSFHTKKTDAYLLHWSTALAVAEVLARLHGSHPTAAGEREPNAIQVLVAMAAWANGQWLLTPAAHAANTALRYAPEDPEVLVTVGALKEAEAMDRARRLKMESGYLDAPGIIGATQEIHQSRAAAQRAYDAALRVRPTWATPHLRIGRLLMLDKKEGRAAVHLRAASLSDSPEERYLAYLFLGGLDERERRLQSAVEDYRKAVEINPAAQAARIGLAHALESAGRHAAVASILRQFVNLPPASQDPWWLYPFGQFRRVQPLIDALRQSTRMP